MSVFRWLGHALLQVKALALFGCRVSVFGNFTVVNPRNVALGANVAINHGVFILGRTGIRIGDNVVLSARCMLMDGGLETQSVAGLEAGSHVERPIVIGDGAWIGAGAIVLPGVTVGPRAVIGAGSVVTKDVEPATVVAGNPARLLRRLVQGG